MLRVAAIAGLLLGVLAGRAGAAEPPVRIGRQGNHIDIGAQDSGRTPPAPARPNRAQPAAAPSVCDVPPGGTARPAVVGACLDVPGPAGPAAGPQLDPAAFVRNYLNAVPLPEPAPRIAPGRMLVGWRAFLEVGGGLDFDFTDATAFGPLEIEAQAMVHVDWGDGSGRDGPYASLGGPFPDGDITHVYINPGDYDVDVTLAWSAAWTFAGRQGTIPTGLSTTATIEDFPVQEGQAVTD